MSHIISDLGLDTKLRQEVKIMNCQMTFENPLGRCYGGDKCNSLL